MKRHKIITVTLVLVLIMSAALAAQASQRPTPASVPKHDGSLDIEVWTNKEEGASFGQGENLVMYFRANRDCYVTIYDLNTEGDINLLYPYDPRDDHWIEGGRVYTIPDYYDDFVLRVNGDPGLEFIQALASEDYFDVPRWGSNFRDPDNWKPIDRESEAIWYLDYINATYFRTDNWRKFASDLDYTYFKVRQDWQYAWDSYYYDDYDYYHTDIHFVYHPYYYRPVHYDPWWDPWDWYGVIYIGYPYGGEVWIDGIYYGIAPLFIPRVCVGWRTVRILSHGNVYYSGKVRVRSGSTHDLYYDGKYKWKSDKRRGMGGSEQTASTKYYPKEKSISYKSSAKYTYGGKSGKSKTYKTGVGYKEKGSKYNYDGTASKTVKTYDTKTKTSIKSKTKDKQTSNKRTGYKSTTGSSGKTKGTSGTKSKTTTGSKNKDTKTKTKSTQPKSKKNTDSYKSNSESRSLPNSRFEWKNSSQNKTSGSTSKADRSYKSGNTNRSGSSLKSRPTYGTSSNSNTSSGTKSRSSGYSGSTKSSSSTSSGNSYRSSGSSSSHSSGSSSKKSSGSKSGSNGSKSKSRKK